MKTKILLAVVLLGVPAIAFGQAEKPAPAPTPTPAAVPAPRPTDVASRDAVVAALYDSISGPAGERDWNRFRSLFIPEAQLIATFKKKDGTLGYRAMTVQDYADHAGKYFKENGFFEKEISRKVETYGDITHIFSTYESRKAADEKPFERGINSIQCLEKDGRWWVVNVFWDNETTDNPIPGEYLPKQA